MQHPTLLLSQSRHKAYPAPRTACLNWPALYKAGNFKCACGLTSRTLYFSCHRCPAACAGAVQHRTKCLGLARPVVSCTHAHAAKTWLVVRQGRLDSGSPSMSCTLELPRYLSALGRTAASHAIEAAMTRTASTLRSIAAASRAHKGSGTSLDITECTGQFSQGAQHTQAGWCR